MNRIKNRMKKTAHEMYHVSQDTLDNMQYAIESMFIEDMFDKGEPDLQGCITACVNQWGGVQEDIDFDLAIGLEKEIEAFVKEKYPKSMKDISDHVKYVVIRELPNIKDEL